MEEALDLSFDRLLMMMIPDNFRDSFVYSKDHKLFTTKLLGNIERNYAIVDSRIMRKWRWLFVSGCEGKTDGFLQQRNF